MHHEPQFYRIRNHLVGFLVHRSTLLAGGETRRPAQPRLVTPGLQDIDAPGDADPQWRGAANVVNFRH